MSPLVDPLDVAATRHAEEAMRETGDTTDAIAILFQAAAAIMITRYPATVAKEMFELASTEMAEELGALIGAGAVRQ